MVEKEAEIPSYRSLAQYQEFLKDFQEQVSLQNLGQLAYLKVI
jgi:hypothetical protein